MQRHNDHIINTAAFSSIGWKSLNRAEDCQVQTHICHLNNLQRIRTTAGKLNKLIYWMIHKYKTNLWPQKKSFLSDIEYNFLFLWLGADQIQLIASAVDAESQLHMKPRKTCVSNTLGDLINNSLKYQGLIFSEYLAQSLGKFSLNSS